MILFYQVSHTEVNKYDMIYWIRIYKSFDYSLSELEAMPYFEIQRIYKSLLLPNVLT